MKNPGDIKSVASRPLAVSPRTFRVAKRDRNLNRSITSGLERALNIRLIERVIKRYDPEVTLPHRGDKLYRAT